MPRKTKIKVHEPAKMRTLESGITVKEVAKQKLKIIEHSEAWKKHQKQHDDAKLQLMGSQQDSEKLEGMERVIVQAGEELEEKKPTKEAEEEVEESKAPGQEVETTVRGAYAQGGTQIEEAKGQSAYMSGGAESKEGGVHYHGGTGGMVMASCSCGQAFKAEENGEVKPYNIGTDVKEEFGSGYKKSGEQQDEHTPYAKKGMHEEIEETRKYGR